MAVSNMNIMHEYEEKRRQAESDAAFRRSEVYQKVPRIREIDEALESTGLNALRSYIRFPSQDKQQLIAALKAENHALREEKAALMKQAGFDEDYMKPRYQCPDCQDTGFIDSVRCHCMQQRLIDLSYEASGIREELERNNFETFKLRLFPNMILDENKPSPRKNMKNLATIAHDYAESFPDNHPHSLIFYGSPGTGKTFLCDCIAKRVLDRGFTVLYLTANQLCSNLDEYRFRRNPARAEQTQIIHDQLDQVDLLIIDDLGSEYLSQVTAADLFECFNQRVLKRKATIVSTNLEPEKLRATYMDRLYSRFTGYYRFLEFYGPDLRTLGR